MNKIAIVAAVVMAAVVANAGDWFPVAPGHEVHIVNEVPTQHTLVGVNVLGIGASVTVPGRTYRETTTVTPIPGAVTVPAPAAYTPGSGYVPTEGKIITTVYPNGTQVTEAPVAPAPVVVTKRVYVPGRYVATCRFGRWFNKWVPGHYEVIQEVQ